MMVQRIVKLSLREEVIEDRAVQDSVIELNYHKSSTPSLHSEEPYECALVLEECMREETVKYAIYKGTTGECVHEHNRLNELRYGEKRPYAQNGNGTPKISTLEDHLHDIKIAQESIDRTVKTINHKTTNKYAELLDEELKRHKIELDRIENIIQETIGRL